MPHTIFPNLEACALCGEQASLQRSHVLPDFLYRRLRAPAGSFYAASRPHLPLQAGAVAKMLCAKCEQSLSRCEGLAQRELFPHQQRTSFPLQYGPWLQLFAVSVSWRALTFLAYATKNPYAQIPAAAEKLLPTLHPSQHERAHGALAQWSAVLRGEITDVGEFEQHIVFLDGENVPNEHLQVVGFTVYESGDTCGVFSQLGSVCIVGLVNRVALHDWSGTEVHAHGGDFSGALQLVPASFASWLRDYFQYINQLEP